MSLIQRTRGKNQTFSRQELMEEAHALSFPYGDGTLLTNAELLLLAGLPRGEPTKRARLVYDSKNELRADYKHLTREEITDALLAEARLLRPALVREQVPQFRGERRAKHFAATNRTSRAGSGRPRMNMASQKSLPIMDVEAPSMGAGLPDRKNSDYRMQFMPPIRSLKNSNDSNPFFQHQDFQDELLWQGSNLTGLEAHPQPQEREDNVGVEPEHRLNLVNSQASSVEHAYITNAHSLNEDFATMTPLEEIPIPERVTTYNQALRTPDLDKTFMIGRKVAALDSEYLVENGMIGGISGTIAEIVWQDADFDGSLHKFVVVAGTDSLGPGQFIVRDHDLMVGPDEFGQYKTFDEVLFKSIMPDVRSSDRR